MLANEIISKASAAKDKHGFVVMWWLDEGKDPVGMTVNVKSIVKNASVYEAKILQTGKTLAFTTPNHPLRNRNELPEQLAVYLATQEEQQGMKEDNDLDEQFWRRDA